MFRVAGARFAIPVSSVRRVEHMVLLSPLPARLKAVRGFADWHGSAVAVFDLGSRLGLPEREMAPAQFLVIAQAGGRLAALVADEIEGPAAAGEVAAQSAEELFGAEGGAAGVARIQEGLVIIYDLGAFLTAEEDAALSQMLEAVRP